MNDEFDREWEAKLMSYEGGLPGERMPGPLLEERTVQALRQRGLLQRRRRVPIAWLVGSAAAALALFATGVVSGQYLATRNAAGLVAELQHRSAGDAAAAQVQQTGTAYVQALQALVDAARQNQSGSKDALRARQVALTALHQAANEMVRLAPNDPVVAKILQGLQQEQQQSQRTAGRQSQRQIVWF